MTKPKRVIDLKSLARSYTEVAVSTLGGIAKDGESESARVAAAAQLLDRGWGKANQPHDAKVEGELRITIRNIIEGKAKDSK